MKIKKIFVGILLIIVLISCFIGFFVYNQGMKQEILLEYGDVIDFEMYEVLQQEEIMSKEGLKLVMYVDPKCGACIIKIQEMQLISQLVPEEDIVSVIIWADKPKTSFLVENEIIIENQYIEKNQKLLNKDPSYLVLNETNEIELITTESDKVLKTLIDECNISNEILMSNADELIMDMYGTTNDSLQSLIYFAMEGCPDCEAIEVVLSNEEIVDYYEVITVYTKDSYDEKIVDYGGILASIYNVEWYPSFRIVKGNDSVFIGELPPNEVEKKLKELILEY